MLLAVQTDETVDVFTSGRKMRVTCSPNIETSELRRGQTVRLNEALTVVEAGNFESVGKSAPCARCSMTATARSWWGTRTKSASCGWPIR